MAQRQYNLGDAPTKPVAWLNMQATSSVAYDATSKRISTIANRGTGGGSFVPPSTATAPLYNATAFGGSLPAATFNYDDPDSLSINLGAVNQPATAVYVWQEGPGVRGYEVFVDHDATSSGNRQQLFTTYGGGTPIYMVRGPVDGVETNVNLGTDVAATPNKINILIVEFNGSASRIYYNGTQMGPYDLGTVVSVSGYRIGGKMNDGATYFGGMAGEFAVLPAIFTGDDWDRVTQGTMWNWGQQANIANGSTYKTAAPMVNTTTAVAVNSASQAQSASSPTLAGRSVVGPSSSRQAQASTSPTVAARGSTQPSSASQGSIATNPTVAARAVAAPASASQASTSTSPTVAARATAIPNSASQSSAATSPTLSVMGSVSVDPAVQAQASTSPALTAHAVTAPDSASQGQQATLPVLSNVRSAIAPSSASQEQASTQPTLGVAGSVNVNDASQQQSATAPVLSARMSTDPASASQAMAATSPVLIARASVTVDSAAQSSAASSPAVSARFTVTPASATQAQAATRPTLSARAVLTVASATSGQVASSPVLFFGQRPMPPSSRTVQTTRISRVVFSPRPSRLAA